MSKIALHTVDARSKLKARHSPYWVRLESGCYLGLRKTGKASEGAWVCRYRDDAGKQIVNSLGRFEEKPPSERYDAAKRAAEAWFDHLDKGGSADDHTLMQACKSYVQHLRDEKREKTAADVEARFKRWVNADTIAALDLDKLTHARLLAWRKTLVKTQWQVNYDDKKPVMRERSASSVNRDMTALRAALNLAFDNRLVTTDIAWRVALRPIKNADGRREVYLDIQQRRELIGKAQADVAAFLRGLSLLPLRPGALAALTVASFDKRLSTLLIGKDKAGKDRKIVLPPTTTAFFIEQVKDKLPAAPLLARADGLAWDKDAWKKPIKAAAAAANLPATTTAYTLRHSTITDLVTGGLDMLTAAQLSGTSAVMIERHYGHLQSKRATQALAGLAL